MAAFGHQFEPMVRKDTAQLPLMSVGVSMARYSGMRSSRAANSRSCASVSWIRLCRLSLNRSKNRWRIPSRLSLYFSTNASPKIFSYM